MVSLKLPIDRGPMSSSTGPARYDVLRSRAMWHQLWALPPSGSVTVNVTRYSPGFWDVWVGFQTS